VSVDEAISDLLAVSTDIRRLTVLDAGGAVLGAGPGRAGPEVGAAAESLWSAAVAAVGRDEGAPAALEHVVVDLGDAAVVALEGGGRRIVALTAADPPLGLVLFDLRTCLDDAFSGELTPDDVAQSVAEKDS
jgi:hypothetical protein